MKCPILSDPSRDLFDLDAGCMVLQGDRELVRPTRGYMKGYRDIGKAIVEPNRYVAEFAEGCGGRRLRSDHRKTKVRARHQQHLSRIVANQGRILLHLLRRGRNRS